MQQIKERIQIKKIIQKKYHELSKNQKKVADYIIQNRRTIFGLSVSELAKNIGVSEATIVRFSKRIGFKGFHELKSQLIIEAKEEMMPEDRFELMSHNKNQISTFFKVAEQEVENINKTINEIDKEQFAEFINLLKSSRYIYTIGIGIASLMARVGAYLFNQAGMKSFFCGRDEHGFVERLIHLSKKDCVLAFSFPPYSRETIDALKFCYERGVKCLAITDKTTAPITRWSNAYLIAKSHNLFFTNSVSAISMILNAVATELAFLNKTKAIKNVKLLNELLSKDFYS